MNGAIYRSSATECLTRTHCGSQGGIQEEGITTQVKVCLEAAWKCVRVRTANNTGRP